MSKQFNLYYILLEDQQRNSMSEKSNEKIQKNIENYFKKIKPPWSPNPPNIIKEDESSKTDK